MLLNFKHLIISISCAPGKTREKNVPGMVNQHATQCANVSGFLINCRSSQCGQVGVASLAFNRFPPRAHNKTTANFPNFGQGQTADFWLGFFVETFLVICGNLFARLLKGSIVILIGLDMSDLSTGG